MPRLLQVLSAATLATLATLASRPADACSPAEQPPSPGVIESVTLATDASTQAALPIAKDGGLVLFVRAGTMTEEALRASLKIEVAPKGEVDAPKLEGALSQVRAPSEQGRSVWSWRPTAAFAAGVLDVKIEVVGQALVDRDDDGIDDRAAELELTVEERATSVPQLALDVSVDRSVTGSTSSPTILCKGSFVGNSCETSVSEHRLATRYEAHPQLRFTSTDRSLERDQMMFSTKARLFTRDDAGVKEEVDALEGFSIHAGEARFAQAAARYCVELTVTSFSNPSVSSVQEKCAEHGALDLTVQDEEQDALVRRSLESCESPEFPEGTSADDPSGTSASSGGCSVVAMPGGGLGAGASSSFALALGLAAAAARRRRSAR